MSQNISHRTLVWLGIVLIASAALAAVGSQVVPKAVYQYYLDLPANPYFVPEHAGLLYVLVPLVVLGGLVMWFLPGIFLALASGKATRWTTLLSQAFGLALIIYFLAISLVKLLTPARPSPTAFFGAVFASGVLSWILLAVRVHRGVVISWPLADRQQIRRFLWTLIIPLVVLLLMLPVFLWQDTHDDGIEALEVGRSLSTYMLIRFPKPGGVFGLGIGMLPMAFPVHWFITLYGPVEAAARFPLLIYLPVVFCLLVDLVEWRSKRFLGLAEEALIALALGVYTVAMGYNASYDVYFADIAAPTALETMTILCMLAAIYYLWRDQAGWFYFFAVLSYLCRPTGLMVLGLLAVAVLLIMPEQRKRWLLLIASAIGLCLLIAFIYDKVYLPRIAVTADVGYNSLSALKRMRYIRLVDFQRLNFGIFPSGILPFFSLLLFPWQDRYARLITLVTIAYYGIFFFQGYAALHHFVPVMIFPVIVFWRMYLNNEIRYRRALLAVTAVAGVVALFLSLPRSFEINRTVRQIGQKISIKIGDYNTNHRAQVEHDTLFFDLIPPDWNVEDASKELISGFNSLIYYGTRPKLAGEEINYIVQDMQDPKPGGFALVANDNKGAALYIRDLGEWERDRFQTLPTDTRSRLYTIPRSTLFNYYFWREHPEGQLVFDIKQVLDFGLALISKLGNR